MQPRKDKDAKKVTVAPKEEPKTKEAGFFDNIFGAKKTEEASKGNTATVAPAPIKINDLKKTQQNGVDLSKLFITAKEIKDIVDKALTEEKSSISTSIKTLFGSKMESDKDTPLGKLKRFSKDVNRVKSTHLSLANVWELLQLALDQEIAPNSDDHKLYQNAIGYKLDMLANQSDFLIKLRWCSNYYPVTLGKFPAICRLAISSNSEADIVEFKSLIPRKSPLVLGVRDTMKEIAADLTGAVDDAVNGATKAVKESTSVTNFI
jgi:hypothetical protein